MAELDLIALVTRANLATPLTPLDLDDGVNFTFGKGVRIGAVAWRKEFATSPFVHGRIPVHEVKDAAESSVVIYVHGASHADLHTNLGVVITAFTEQYEYELRLQVNGQDYHWRCERSDYDVAFATETLNALYVPVVFSFYRHPIPVVGAF